ncbi:lipid-A-disaccharide synthase [Candidatus Poribacteria bacterium]|nr:lipid-A-disaccharide synthase [Candidatus Poribacteria bacterium]
MIVAGEPSGDLHASHVVTALKKQDTNITIYGMGGDMMEKSGVSLDIHIKDSAVMGILEAVTVLPKFLKKLSILKKRLRENRPDVLLLIDFAEFNTPLAKYAHKLNIKIVYYIPPKAWAWRPGRAKKIARRTDVVASIFPFEMEFYKNAGATVEFVGHPLVDFAYTDLSIQQAREKLELQKDTDVIGLMPGSRRSEVQRILPIMFEAASQIHRKYPEIKWILPKAPGISNQQIESCKMGINGIPEIKLIEKNTYNAMRAATLMLVTSGTATLETACIGTPMIILYRTSKLNWKIVNWLTHLEHSGLPNLIAGERIVPELLQEDLSVKSLTDHTINLIQNPNEREKQKTTLKHVYDQLGESGVAEKTAQIILHQAASITNT